MIAAHVVRLVKVIHHDRPTGYSTGQRVRAADPAVAASRQISKAEPDSDGAVPRPVTAFPAAEAETGGVSTATAFDRLLLMGLAERPVVKKPAELLYGKARSARLALADVKKRQPSKHVR